MSQTRSYGRYLRRIQRQQQLMPTILQHYDSLSDDLRAWLWYVK
jgi:hypothetical protein